jgi:hypothetical protein
MFQGEIVSVTRAGVSGVVVDDTALLRYWLIAKES